MNVRELLAVVRDLSTLVLGLAGVVHEEWYTSQERPVLIGLYAACLAGVALVNGRKLVQVLGKMSDSKPEPDVPVSITAPGTSSSPP